MSDEYDEVTEQMKSTKQENKNISYLIPCTNGWKNMMCV
jgi:hypothetical protein